MKRLSDEEARLFLEEHPMVKARLNLLWTHLTTRRRSRYSLMKNILDWSQTKIMIGIIVMCAIVFSYFGYAMATLHGMTYMQRAQIKIEHLQQKCDSLAKVK